MHVNIFNLILRVGKNIHINSHKSMKKSLLLLGVTASAMSLSAANASEQPQKDSFNKAVAKVAKINAENAARMASNWQAGCIENYYWGGADWEPAGKTLRTFNANGTIASLSEDHHKTEFLYDDQNRLITQKSYSDYEGDWQLEATTYYEYDTVVTDMVIKTTYEYSWGDGYSQGKEITRNEAGNVTKVQDYYIYEDGEKSYDGEVLIIEYGADGKACSVFEEYYGEIEESYTDITWENTDGQIFEIEIDDPDSDSYFGANRIKSAIVNNGDVPGDEAQLTVTYDGVNYHSLLMMGEVRLAEINYTSVDDYGSYDATHFECDYDRADDGEGYVLDFTRDRETTYRVDAYGLLLEDMSTTEYHYTRHEDETEVEGQKADVVYDETYGYPLEYILSYKSYSYDDFELSSRTVFSDYTDFGTSGINSVVNEDAEAEYFNIQGVKVDNPTNGLYIRRQGSTVTKVIINN